MKKYTIKYVWLVFIVAILYTGCKQKYTPKPRGYYRIDFPEKNYHWLDNRFPYAFEIPDYAEIVQDSRNPNELYWINVSVPANNAEVHISYYELTGNSENNREKLSEIMEESRELAYKHTIKANAINEQLFINNAENVYGVVYKIEGNAASPLQFFLTDSSRHFLRGALYIREVPNIDSIQPVIDFLIPDVVHLIETTSWK